MNPPGKDGWEKSGAGRSEKAYGECDARGNKRRGRVEQVRQEEGYASNGRGRKGDVKKGYVVYGEYVKVLEKKAKKEKQGRLERKYADRSRRSDEETGMGEEERLGRKRERRARRYAGEVGTKVNYERVNRCEVRDQRGRKEEVEEIRRRRARSERTYREKTTGKPGAEEVRREKRGKAKSTEEQKAVVEEGREVRRKEKNRKEKVRTEARAVVVVRGGVRRIERRRVKRRIRKREGSGRKHRQVRREWGGRRKAHARKSKNGRVVKGARNRRGPLASRKPSREASSDEKRGLSMAKAFEPKERKGGYYGYRVTVKGTLGGSLRTKRIVRSIGTVPESIKSARIGTAEGVAKTSVGTRGVQVAYCYGRG